MKYFKWNIGRGKPSIAGLSPLENSPPDCFQFTLLPSSFKAFRARGAGEKSFAACGSDQRGSAPLDTSPARGGAGSADALKGFGSK